MNCDAIVVGAGIVGAAIARELAKAGLFVIVLERDSVASGTTSRGEGNILVSDKAPGPELALAIAARRRWAVVSSELREELGPRFPDMEFESKGGLVVSTESEGNAPLHDFAAAQRAAGVANTPVTPGEARDLEPNLDPRIAGAVWYPDDAQVQPVIATEALLASARRAGARVMVNTEVLGALQNAAGELEGVLIASGSVRAPLVVNAAGPWSGEVAAALGAPIPVHPRRGVVLVTTRMPVMVRHKVYDADYVGAVESDSGALQTSSVVESTRGGTVLIGSSRERVGFRDEFGAGAVAMLARKAIRLFPMLGSASIMRSYSGFRPYIPDHIPLIGADPRLPGLWHATGHEGAGVGLSLATGQLIADGVLGRSGEIDPAPFAMDRESLRPHLEMAS